MIIDGSSQERGSVRARGAAAGSEGPETRRPNSNRGEEGFSMAKFRCLECKKEFEAEVIAGKMKRGKSWSAKSYSVR